MTVGPAHVGLIPDGLRRWAVENNTTLYEAYLRGAEKVTEILVTLQRHQVRTVSVYNLSRANLGRSESELDAVYQASIQFCTKMIPANFDPAVCGVRFHGALDLLPAAYSAAARDLQAAVTGNRFRINILAAYDADEELRTAHLRAGREGCDITAAFEIGQVDMIIRTTPEPLLSGFLPIQSQYAKLNFLDIGLNDLNERQIDELIAGYRQIPQRLGR